MLLRLDKRGSQPSPDRAGCHHLPDACRDNGLLQGVNSAPSPGLSSSGFPAESYPIEDSATALRSTRLSATASLPLRTIRCRARTSGTAPSIGVQRRGAHGHPLRFSMRPRGLDFGVAASWGFVSGGAAVACSRAAISTGLSDPVSRNTRSRVGPVLSHRLSGTWGGCFGLT